MPVLITCPQCDAKLKVAALPPPGKKMRCPKCESIFAPEQPQDEDDSPKPAPPKAAPAPAAAPSFKKKRDEDDDDRDDRDDRDDDYDDDRRGRKSGKGGGKKSGSRRRTGPFEFDGTAGDFFVVYLLTALLTMFTFGLAFPWTMCMFQKWKIEHTLHEGRRLQFHGTGSSLLGLFIVTYFLIFITLGIYVFWAVPKLERWIVENTDIED